MKSIETVGILGLGKLGCPIAAHLVAKGFKVVGYDPLEEARNRAVALGARGAASAREAARASGMSRRTRFFSARRTASRFE